MTDANFENLSAAADGELSREELRFLLRRIDHDTQLLETWNRYHVAGDSLRRQLPPLATAGLSVRIMQVIEEESGGSQATPRRRDWLRLSAGGAIAASVAVAALMMSRPTAPDSVRPIRLAAVKPVAAPSAPQAVEHAPSMDANALAAVPPSLSAYSASGLSQQATFSGTSDNLSFQRYPMLGPNYSINGYKALDNHDGSYLLLIDRPQARAATPVPVYQGATGR